VSHPVDEAIRQKAGELYTLLVTRHGAKPAADHWRRMVGVVRTLARIPKPN